MADPAVVADAWRAWHEEVAFAEQFVAGSPDLAIRSPTPDGTTVALREVILHMVEEYARHLGRVRKHRAGSRFLPGFGVPVCREAQRLRAPGGVRVPSAPSRGACAPRAPNACGPPAGCVCPRPDATASLRRAAASVMSTASL